ncbi:hypothetical protein [Streptomyces sp. NPDC059639]|uniref:hypothetical protein n=1 Tax=Streptomyces sp. NPDC059639 TaxID=3346891 RepID=UPI00368565AD
MTPVLTSLIAVTGTLLGAALGYLFQRRNTDRAERRAAVLTYANAATDVIRSQQDWWHRRNEEAEGAEHRAARLEAHRLRSAARQAINGLNILLPDNALLDQAEATFTVAGDVHRATSSADLDNRSTEARQSIRAFIALAATKIS